MATFDGRSLTYGFGELDTLVPAYAATIHKSQGSEYPAVVIPVLTQHYAMLQRNLLYTGVTRGKRLVVLSARRRLSRSRFATYRAGDAGRSSTNGFGSAGPARRSMRRRRAAAGPKARFSRLTNGCAWNAVSASANCGRAVAHVRGSYGPTAEMHDRDQDAETVLAALRMTSRTTPGCDSMGT